MPRKERRYVWQVDLGNGEVLFLNYLANVRRTVLTSTDPGAPHGLHRLDAGSYYVVDPYDTPGGRRARLIRVVRVPATRADAETVNDRLPFDAVDVALQVAESHRGV